jgi:tetratricopeptide (TPR) repeat protein
LAQALSAGDLQRADALFQEGFNAIPNEPRYALDRIFCLERGSEIANNSGNSRNAMARAQAARDMLQRLPIRSELADLNTLITLASSYSGAGRFPEAAAAFEHAAARLAELGRADTQRSGTVFNNWDVGLIRAGRPWKRRESSGGQSISAWRAEPKKPCRQCRSSITLVCYLIWANWTKPATMPSGVG